MRPSFDSSPTPDFPGGGEHYENVIFSQHNYNVSITSEFRLGQSTNSVNLYKCNVAMILNRTMKAKIRL